jgi:hypothetical protein
MFAKVFSEVKFAILGAAVACLTAAPALGIHRGGPMGGHGFQPHYGNYGGYYGYYRYYGGYRGDNPYHGYHRGYGAYDSYSGYPYGPSSSDFDPTTAAPAQPVVTPEAKSLGVMLAASGVPTEAGRPAWPLALRILGSQEAQDLRAQIDALIQVAATQAVRGRPNATVADELVQATNRLRTLLHRHRAERGGMAQHSYEEAERFLDKLENAQKLLR